MSRRGLTIADPGSLGGRQPEPLDDFAIVRDEDVGKDVLRVAVRHVRSPFQDPAPSRSQEATSVLGRPEHVNKSDRWLIPDHEREASG